MEDYVKDLATMLGVEPQVLQDLDRAMTERTGKKGVLKRLYEKNQGLMRYVLDSFKVEDPDAESVSFLLRQTIQIQEKEFYDFLEIVKGATEFEQAANLAREIAQVGKGYFLKRDIAREILKKRPPQKLLDFLGYKTVNELIEKEDVTEIFAALRFIESNEWMHQTFEVAYSGFTANDFEERDIEIKVLGEQWKEVAKKFVEKKRHNVSHLKEFGVIFINPIKEDIPGKFLRDFALLLHYFHEISFYSKLFRRYSEREDFGERLKSVLRGDILDVQTLKPAQWLIVQRYLNKENPDDPRLSLPRVNPESLHWARGERDITLFRPKSEHKDLNIWHNLDWVGGIFKDGQDKVVSFDLEDNAMSLVSFMEGKKKNFNYHQQEAMWTKLFMEYVGGEEKTEELLIENFESGLIEF